MEVLNESLEKNELDDKIETKGLKLKKSTKEKLNELQKGFDDAESMITALIKQYNNSLIVNDNRFLDRKAEIDKFNFLVDSIKSSFVNSLEMAVFAEERALDIKSKEMKKKDILISSLQDEKEELKKQIKEMKEEKIAKDRELSSVKDSFSRINLSLVNLEKELKEKSEIIQNNQNHINSLTNIAEEGVKYKEEVDSLKDYIKTLESKINDYKMIQEKLDISNNKILDYKSEILSYKEDIQQVNKINNELNKKIQDIIMQHSDYINKIKDENSKTLLDLQEKLIKENQYSNEIILKLKEEILELKLKSQGFLEK